MKSNSNFFPLALASLLFPAALHAQGLYVIDSGQIYEFTTERNAKHLRLRVWASGAGL